MTIKKIDEIEAQMSNQWWQGKSSGSPRPGGTAPVASTDAAPSQSPPQAESDLSYAPTRLSPMRPDATMAEAESSDFPPTQSHSGFGPSTGPTELPVTRPPDSVPPTTTPGRGFTHSRPTPVEWVEGMSDPDLEEAAIRFANGDEGGAEASLQAALSNPQAKPDRAVRWGMALLDLYRATGRQGHFDVAAIEFAERFNRSAPPWFSIPANLGLQNASALVRTLPSRLSADPLWRSPARFTDGSVDDLRLAIANAEAPWYLDWEPITAIEPAAVEPLAGLFAEWCTTPVAAAVFRRQGAGSSAASLCTFGRARRQPGRLEAAPRCLAHHGHARRRSNWSRSTTASPSKCRPRPGRTYAANSRASARRNPAIPRTTPTAAHSTLGLQAPASRRRPHCTWASSRSRRRYPNCRAKSWVMPPRRWRAGRRPQGVAATGRFLCQPGKG